MNKVNCNRKYCASNFEYDCIEEEIELDEKGTCKNYNDGFCLTKFRKGKK